MGGNPRKHFNSKTFQELKQDEYCLVEDFHIGIGPLADYRGLEKWSSRQTHYLKNVGSNPTPATRINAKNFIFLCIFCLTFVL